VVEGELLNQQGVNQPPPKPPLCSPLAMCIFYSDLVGLGLVNILKLFSFEVSIKNAIKFKPGISFEIFFIFFCHVFQN
jgi:hypothetical protein